MHATAWTTHAKALGLRVVQVPGWRATGHGDMVAVRGVVAHHTAGPRTGNLPSLPILRHGRPHLAGPLCNMALARDGTVYALAAGRAYHAGTGSHAGLTYGNTYLLGIEAESSGRGDWTPSQITAYPRLCAALAITYGFEASWVIGHLEWAPGRKIDPHGWPGGMDGLRRQTLAVMVAARTRRGSPHPAPKPKTGAKAKARVARKLLVDGRFGVRTVKALQVDLHLSIVTGRFDGATRRALQRRLHVPEDGVIGPVTARALQRRVGVRVDGVIGQVTIAALQRRLNSSTPL